VDSAQSTESSPNQRPTPPVDPPPSGACPAVRRLTSCYSPSVQLIRPPLVLVLAVLLSCYPDPTFPDVEPAADESDGSASAVGSPAPSSAAPTRNDERTTQSKRRQDVVLQIERVGASAGVARSKRPGAGEWRPVELEKLAEIVTACCSASDLACRDCLAPLSHAALATDEIWAIYGAFLGPLRNRASAGVGVLGAKLLQAKEGQVRDRALRVATGSGVLPRPEESEDGFRVSTLPRSPAVGESVLIIVEKSAPCSEVTAEVKGPDGTGRVVLDPSSRCPGAAEDESTGEFVPKATRYVLTHRVEALPAAGLNIWLAGGKAPLLRVVPSRPPEAQRDPG
jgi:hypothetical protein